MGKLARKDDSFNEEVCRVCSAQKTHESFMIIRIPAESRDSDLDLVDSQTRAFQIPEHLSEEEEGSHDVRKMVSVTRSPVGWKRDLASGSQQFRKLTVGSAPRWLRSVVVKNDVVKQRKVLVVSSPYMRMFPGLWM